MKMKKNAKKKTVPKSTVPARWNGRAPGRTLGVVMIVKDEAENLPELFASIRDLADEVVVVDTGSKDGTVGICREWGVTLLQAKWRDDFAWARNRGLGAAAARYLLWLDADDRVPAETAARLAEMRDGELREGPLAAYDVLVHNLDARGAARDTFVQTRLFPRHPGVRFRNAVHEEVVTSLRAEGIPRRETELAVLHTGYASPEEVRAKQKRYEAMLLRSLREDGPSVQLLVQFAQTVAGAGRLAEAGQALGSAIEVEEAGEARPALLAEMHALRALYRLAEGDRVGAEHAAARAEALRPGWCVPAGLLADLRAREGDWEGALREAERARAADAARGETGIPVARIRSGAEWIAALAHRRAGRPEEADACLRAALRVDPFNLDARMELGAALLEAEAYADAREVLEPAGEDEAAVERFAEVASAIGLARAMTGDEAGAVACLAPLLDVFAAELGGAHDVGVPELAGAALRAGEARAAKHLLTLHQRTALAAA